MSTGAFTLADIRLAVDVLVDANAVSTNSYYTVPIPLENLRKMAAKWGAEGFADDVWRIIYPGRTRHPLRHCGRRERALARIHP